MKLTHLPKRLNEIRRSLVVQISNENVINDAAFVRAIAQYNHMDPRQVRRGVPFQFRTELIVSSDFTQVVINRRIRIPVAAICIKSARAAFIAEMALARRTRRDAELARDHAKYIELRKVFAKPHRTVREALERHAANEKV